MATLQKIRNRGGLLVIVLGIALLAFILGDLFTSGNTWLNKFKDKAFVVDGDVVSTGAYQDRITQMEEFQKFMSGRNSLDENITSQIREFVYEQMVKEMMLYSQTEKLGLSVTKEELNDMVYGENVSPVLLQSPIFTDPQTRQFNREALMEFLSYIQTDISTVPDEQKMQLYTFQQQWMVIENMMKYNCLEQKYNALLTSSIKANDIEAKVNYEDSKTSAEILYAVNRYTSIADSTVSVTKQEIEKLYNERKNNFKTDTDLRKITYLVRSIEPSEADYKAVEDEMSAVYNKLVETNNPALVVADYSEVPYQDVFFSESMLSPEEKEFAQTASIGDVHGPIRDNDAFRLYKLVDRTVAPDSVNLKMIVLPQGTPLARVDSIYGVINGGKDFATVANEINPQSNGGEIGWATEPMLASAGEEFISKVYSASKGDLLRMNLNGHNQIVKVEDITRPVPKVKLALVQMSVSVSDKTTYDIDNELNQFVAENGKSETFYNAAMEKGYNVYNDVMLRPSSIGLPQINGSYQVVLWAFNNKKGSVKKFDLTDQRVIALLDEEIAAGYMPMVDVSEELKNEIIKDKKAEKIIADLKAKNLNSLDAYATAMQSRVDTVKSVRFSSPSVPGLGREPMINVYSKYAELNKLEGPFKGNSGVYVMNVQNRVDDDVEFNAQNYKALLNNSYQYRVNPQEVFNTLKQKLDVDDNRVKVYYRGDE